MHESLYHIFLRTSALTLSLVLLFVSGVLSPVTQQLSQDTELYLASAIGIKAAVAPTEINTLAAELLARDKQLTEREIAINLKEAKASSSPDVATFILSIAVFVLLVLMILNYTLDYRRARQRYEQKVTTSYEKMA
jgi:hypothetical protein